MTMYRRAASNRDEQEVLVRANASVTDPAQKSRNLFVREPVRIGDVATVFLCAGRGRELGAL